MPDLQKFEDHRRSIPKRNAIPIHYVRGTHYEVGYSMGRTFGQMIKEFIKDYTPLQEENLKLFMEPEGQIIYEESLELTRKYFPQYIIELQGIADGAQVSFEELFLMALDDTLPLNMNKNYVDKGAVGCTSLIINQPDGQYLGHTEDALAETEDNYYIIAAHVMPGEDELNGVFQAREEKFEALAYAGHLPGYASGHNFHGVVFSINTIFVTKPLRGRIPREFITRALLSSRADMSQIVEILTNEGAGTADAFNVNVAFVNVPKESRVFYSIEVIPSVSEFKSQVYPVEFIPGNNSLHANRLLHLKYPESKDIRSYESSINRECRYQQLSKCKIPRKLNDVLEILGDEENGIFSIFRNQPNELVKTIHLGKKYK
ncbi:uncharacterized protein LOC126908630 isoform X1 [Daktulosphaira vitifoliae]|uniref:uncharacterized protein LOC126908630 isoform X1 n=2 Tax=Daktulosphaira vitifoliae TaxID=58002 RepID=UPI0021AA7D4F|nr:uncharacterized protein LOC126908630 isoform X1 [Daktulosphaira vitifoliae]